VDVRIGVLGTGTVGVTLATRLVELGHEVRMGSRTADNEAAASWAATSGEGAGHGTFGDAAAFAERLVINATAGAGSLDALAAAGDANLDGKVVLDASNPLDFSSGELRFTIANHDSLAETIQRSHPGARVVKALNMVNAAVMTDPIDGTNLFVCGDDAAAKADVVELLGSFGWPRDAVIDLGDLGAARGMEMYLALWLRVRGALGTARFNVGVVRG
jgi:hypothetical protein